MMPPPFLKNISTIVTVVDLVKAFKCGACKIVSVYLPCHKKLKHKNLTFALFDDFYEIHALHQAWQGLRFTNSVCLQCCQQLLVKTYLRKTDILCRRVANSIIKIIKLHMRESR